MENKKLLEIEHLKQHFPVASGKLFEKKVVKAVDDVSFFINKGDSGTGRRVRLRQDDHRPYPAASLRAYQRPHYL